MSDYTERENTCALWFFQHYGLEYDLCEDEAEAADYAAHLTYYGEASIIGIQFADGRVIHRGEWDAFDQALDEHEREQQKIRLTARTPRRQVRDPFNLDRLVWVEIEEPEWLGVKP